MRIYLAGPIFGRSDAEAREWRQAAAMLLSEHECVDPTVWDYRGREDDHATEIVRRDLAEIDGCDAVLAMCPQPSMGTAMEVFYAARLGKLVIAVVPSGRVSPWLRAHARITRTLPDACASILALTVPTGSGS